ncbi:Kae1-associated kinase Bud32 [Candidatus Pacearchaeota archaeon]|nr:Kae1-associated kinase Bud32 [Candidatus Pacearchaeota archaeon]
MTSKIIQQGAEALILLDKNIITKKRIEKSYRISELDDKIRKLRTRSETKLLEKASKIVSIPKMIKSNEKIKEIDMEFIDGKKLSEHLDKYDLKKQKEICNKIGDNISKLHDSDIIHGDLTTSNMILKEDKLYFIDFGLGFISSKYEDKAVDLHLLKKAIEAKHSRNWEILFEEIIKEYKKYKDSRIVLEKLKTVEKRGRYKK